jgi:hypothetical protein
MALNVGRGRRCSTSFTKRLQRANFRCQQGLPKPRTYKSGILRFAQIIDHTAAGADKQRSKRRCDIRIPGDDVVQSAKQQVSAKARPHAGVCGKDRSSAHRIDVDADSQIMSIRNVEQILRISRRVRSFHRSLKICRRYWTKRLLDRI